MTRFWIALEHGVQFVLDNLEHMHGGGIFVPKIPNMKIMDLAKAVEDDARHTIEFDDYYAIILELSWANLEQYKSGKKLPEGFSYTSYNNTEWLEVEELKQLV